MKALCATPLLMALASTLPGILVCFRSVKLAQWRVFPGRHLVASSTSGPPMMVPAQCRWGKRHSRGFIEHPISMKALGAKPLLVAMASTLPGIQVWFRLVKTCSAACASQPTFGRCSAEEWCPPGGRWGNVHPRIHPTPHANGGPFAQNFF